MSFLLAHICDVLTKLVHLPLSYLLHLLLKLELIRLHLKLQIKLSHPSIVLSTLLLDLAKILLLHSGQLFNFLLEVHHDHRWAYDVVIDDDAVLLTFQLGAQEVNGFVLLSDQVVLALVLKFALPKRVN